MQPDWAQLKDRDKQAPDMLESIRPGPTRASGARAQVVVCHSHSWLGALRRYHTLRCTTMW